MIPTQDQAYQLWDTYQLPEKKRLHSKLVADVARWFMTKIEETQHCCMKKDLVYKAALLHDIDKNIPWENGEKHPDAGVRVLRSLGFDEVAALVRTHPLHAILDDAISPKTLEEKVLYLADKMVKYDVISVEERFAIWSEEHLSQNERKVLEESYPKVKQLEKEIEALIQQTSQQLLKNCKHDILQPERKQL